MYMTKNRSLGSTPTFSAPGLRSPHKHDKLWRNGKTGTATFLQANVRYAGLMMDRDQPREKTNIMGFAELNSLREHCIQ